MVFEPRDEHKGNVARAMTYFAHRYGFPLSGSELSLYQSWHSSDPVDQAELDRTWAIAAEQGVPNPYVVCTSLLPEL
jgi:endonuclease I